MTACNVLLLAACVAGLAFVAVVVLCIAAEFVRRLP